jgi:hypothetical protein
MAIAHLAADQVSISPTFHEQLLRQNPFAKKSTNPNSKHIKAAQKNSYEKAARKILVKLTPGVNLTKEFELFIVYSTDK